MKHVAIDLGGRESQICMRAEDGQILEEDRRATLGLQKYLAGLEPAKVVLETCAAEPVNENETAVVRI